MLVRVRTRHLDGRFRTLECACVNRLLDADVGAIIVTLRDVSEQVELQATLRQSHDRLRLALSAARAISWTWDVGADAPVYTDDWARFFGLTREESTQSEQCIHPDDREAVRDEMKRCLATNGEYQTEFRGLDRGKNTRWYRSNGRLRRDVTDTPMQMVGITWDVTELRRLEHERELLDRRMQESQKLESLGVLAGGIAHDFNNLLMAILGNTSLTQRLLGEGSESEASRYLAQIEEAARSAADLCRQMLAYAGKGRFVLTVCDVNDLIEQTTHLLQVSISKKAVLRFHLHANLPPVVVDATQIRQVLMNFVLNASDAIGDRSGIISISSGLVRVDRSYLDTTFLTPALPEGDYVYLEVSDSGSGMSPETQARIFEPFFSTKFAGRGLGLAAVLGIVRGHRGAIKVYSELGKGTSFKVLLPASYENRDSPALTKIAPPLAARGTILVVDDEETVLAVAGRMLEQLGFRVVTVPDGRRAVELFRAQRNEFIAVLMDLTMPHLDGEQTFHELRRIDPNMRVLLMSGYNEQEAIGRFVGKGLAGFIQKPFSLNDLREKLRLLLG